MLWHGGNGKLKVSNSCACPKSKVDTVTVWLTCSDPALGEFVLLCHTVVMFLGWHGWGYEWGMKNLREIVIFRPCASFPGGRAYLCADGRITSERDQAARHLCRVRRARLPEPAPGRRTPGAV